MERVAGGEGSWSGAARSAAGYPVFKERGVKVTTTRHEQHRVRYDLKIRVLQVRRVARPTPRLVRVTLGGPDLDGFQCAGPADHVKVFFPAPGEQQPVLPTMSRDGIQPPVNGERPTARDYTPRRFDPVTGELDIDIVLHGDGPASAWAMRAAPGQQLGVAGPRGSHLVTPDFDWYLLAGDETALPTISRWLERLPSGVPATVIVEVADAADEQPLPTQASITMIWLHRQDAAPGTTDLLDQAIRAVALPPGEGYVWIAGEARTLRPIRRYLLQERGLNPDWVSVDGYWKRGVANLDHHAPDTDD